MRNETHVRANTAETERSIAGATTIASRRFAIFYKHARDVVMLCLHDGRSDRPTVPVIEDCSCGDRGSATATGRQRIVRAIAMHAHSVCAHERGDRIACASSSSCALVRPVCSFLSHCHSPRRDEQHTKWYKIKSNWYKHQYMVQHNVALPPFD